MRFSLLAAAVLCCIALSPTARLAAQESSAEATIRLGQGQVVLTAPAKWVKKAPASRIIEYEFAAPGEGEGEEARVTMMGAAGGVEANVARWETQFDSEDGGKVQAQVENSKVGECEVHLVNLQGVYLDRPGGPFAGGKTVRRPDYRMLGVIIVTPKGGQYYIKMYGPSATVEAHAAALKEMVQGLKTS